MKKSKNYILGILYLLVTFSLSAQIQTYDAIEKIYIQTDKPMYLPGDEIYYNLKAVNGAHLPTLLSESVFISLEKPDGTKMYDKEYLLNSGNLTDKIKLQLNLPGGIYKFTAYTEWMQDQGDSVLYTKEIMVQKYVAPRILMTMELDKESYTGGDVVSATYEAKDLQDNAIAHTDISYAIYADGEIIADATKKTDRKGKATLGVVLPHGVEAQSVSLSAKIDYRGKKESISKRIPIIKEDIDLQFLPEGGFALHGYRNQFAFKALASNGKPADVAGVIVDDKGYEVTRFSSLHDGMGKLSFIPDPGVAYFAKLEKPYTSEELIPLANIVNDGVKIEVENHDKDFIEVDIMGEVNTDMKLSLSNICEEKWSKIIHSSEAQKIDTRGMISGIYRLSLAKNDVIISERLLYLHPDKGMKVDIEVDKGKYDLRGEVKVKIKTTSEDGEPIPAELAIAVAEDKMLSFADDKQAHIVSELMMSSELEGDVYEPNYYFDSIDTKKIAALDLVMMTNGWRSHIQNPDVQGAFAHYQMDHSYIGQVVFAEDKKRKKTEVLLVNYSKMKAYKIETDEDGYFSFPMNKQDYYTTYINSNTNEAYIKNISGQERATLMTQSKKKWVAEMKMDGLIGTILEEVNDVGNESKLVNVSLEEGALLDEVVVMGYSVPLIDMDNTTTGAVVTAESIRSLPTRNINAIAATAVSISATEGSPISIRGSRSDATVYYVDGIRVSAAVPQMKDMLFEEVRMEVDMDDRQFRNATRFDKSKKLYARSIGSKRTQSPRPYSFYIPQYTSQNVVERNDFRQTIYWNPMIQTDQNGEAEISFFTSDEVTSFSVLAEGISISGDVGRGTGKVVNSKPISTDCKLPNFFVLGDETVLSIVVDNDTEKNQEVSMNIESQKALQFQTIGNASTTIKAGESHVFQVKVIADSQESGELTITISGDNVHDVMKKKFDVLSPYFPMQYSAAGVSSDTFLVQLESPLMSTISAKFKLYNPVESALEGIESMLRTPNGCFEQVSSSTYPNVMVLQYLNQKGQTDGDISSKALKYIDLGYEKLAAYETPVDGFHWWGKAPGNVALTAYGLLEFTDMAKVYDNVDMQMIERTIDYLLDHKDGKGGFTLGKGYDGFGNAIYDVQAAYVVYALSQHAGSHSKMKKEYNSALKKAMESKDLYQSALLALAAKNMDKLKDFDALLQTITEKTKDNLLSDVLSANTITRSGKEDNNTETLALCALALMQDKKTDYQQVLDIINHISSKRKRGRFGSTQATCLSIQAILAYANWTVRDAGQGEISAFIDEEQILNNTTTSTADASALITDDTHQFVTSYGASSGLNYELDVRYETTLPPTSENHSLDLKTEISKDEVGLADQVSLTVELENNRAHAVANPTLVIGIPSGTSLQHKQLKEMKEDEKFDYFEIFENRLVLYFNEMSANEKRTFVLDLKADIKGTFQAPPSKAYLYYDEENVVWIAGAECKIY